MREIPINPAAFVVIPANRFAMDFIEDYVPDFSPLEQMDDSAKQGCCRMGTDRGKRGDFFVRIVAIR